MYIYIFKLSVNSEVIIYVRKFQGDFLLFFLHLDVTIHCAVIVLWYIRS